VATVLELAAYADVSAENVLRVGHGEPVGEDVGRRVHDAIDALGPPPYPRQIGTTPTE
jgi:DNA-binding LacI/PurR family transcriptional regulator